MQSTLEWFCSPGGFMPHGQCYLWTPGIVWLHVVSDALITLSYYSIPVSVALFVRQRRDADFRWMYLCFAIFILACGTTHLLEIWNVWHADYWVSGFAKALTAAASVPTAFFVVKLLPVALSLPSPSLLRRVNAELSAEIATRTQTQLELQEMAGQRERHVAERTAELQIANAELQRQITERDRARELLRESDDLFSKAFRLSPDCMVIARIADRTVIRANEALCRLWGSTPEQIVGRPTQEYVHWVREDERLAFMQTLSDQGECLDYETTLSLSEGRILPFSLSSRMVTLNSEACSITVLRDITERKRAEAATALLSSIVTSSDDAIVGEDLNRIVTTWNAGATRIFGYTADEMAGQSELRLIPSDRQDEETAILRRVTNGETIAPYDTVRRHKDGHVIDVSVTVSPIRDSRGRIMGASKIARDITERRKGEASLRESDERTRMATEATAVGIWEWNVTTNQIHWNAEMFRIYGIGPTPDGFVSYDTWRSAIWPDELVEQEHLLQETVRLQRRDTREFSIRRAHDGERRNIRAVQTVRTGAAGQTKWVLGTNLDITASKQTEAEIRHLNAGLEERVAERTAQLEAANNELEAFSYSVSHDLRAPLRAVNGFSRIVMEDYGALLPPEGQRCLKNIGVGALQMGTLIDDLLTFSRLSRLPLSLREVSVALLVKEALDELVGLRENRTVEITVGELPTCQGDPALLKQVWINLISNALKYSRKRNPAIVEIGCERQNDENVYFIRDNGTGFDMRYADKLFGVFQRLHRAEEFEGTGVGLAIVQRVVHRHGGRVWAEAAVDRGATFYLTLEAKKL